MIWAPGSDLFQLLIDYDLLISFIYFLCLKPKKIIYDAYILHLPNSGGISSKLISVMFTFFLGESMLLKYGI